MSESQIPSYKYLFFLGKKLPKIPIPAGELQPEFRSENIAPGLHPAPVFSKNPDQAAIISLLFKPVQPAPFRRRYVMIDKARD